MKSALRWFEDMMCAVTFAEAGQWQDARRMAGYADRKTIRGLGWFERMSAAVAMAEEGLHDDALRIARLEDMPQHESLSDFIKNVGLTQAHIRVLVVRVEAAA